jgi:hypothetical protein
MCGLQIGVLLKNPHFCTCFVQFWYLSNGKNFLILRSEIFYAKLFKVNQIFILQHG